MTLPVIYISLYLLTVALCFIRIHNSDKYRKALITIHLLLLIVLLADLIIINFRGVWLDRIIAIAFMLTASATFTIYRKTLRIWQRLYFGFFVFYPIIALITFLMDRILFAVIASPLLICLTIPEIIYVDKDYEIRESVAGPLAAEKLQLIKQNLITERSLGFSEEDALYSEISDFKISKLTEESTKAIITSKDKKYVVTFYK